MKLFDRRPASEHVTATGYSVIDKALTISGNIDTGGTIRVDGRLDGTLHKADTIIIGAGGVVLGDVEAREVIVGGELTGGLTVTERVEIQATATIRGDIRGAAVHLVEGGKVHGHISIHPVSADIPQIPVERRLALTPGIGSRAIAQG